MKGLKTYRHASNPLEKVFHDTFINNYGHSLESIVKPVTGNGYRNEFCTKEEEELMITTIQWLGSPVGIGFLRDCGFKQKDKPHVGGSLIGS